MKSIEDWTTTMSKILQGLASGAPVARNGNSEHAAQTGDIAIGVYNFSILIDLYKHHWDAFFRGFVVYLFACSVLAGYGISQTADIFNQLFAGFSLAVASLITFLALFGVASWFREMSEKVEKLARENGLTSVTFKHTVATVHWFQAIAAVILITGLLYDVHIVLVKIFGMDLIARMREL